MRRLLKCDKDAYITSKIVNGVVVADANTGQAGTIDLYKLYDETYLSGTTAPIELSRGLLHFDLQPLFDVTDSFDINDPSFKCELKLQNIYGGQPVPSNFTFILYPLAKPFSEGRGSDVVAYRDIDATNWITASVVMGTPVLWESTGSNTSGSLGTNNIDFYHSGALPPTLISSSLGVAQTFARGDEDLVLDVTHLISGTIAGFIPDNGFRLSFIPTQEQDQYTYFVKRFYSRHAQNPNKHPKIEIKVNNSITDHTLNSFFDHSNSLFIYNKYQGQYWNFNSGSSEVTGSNCLLLELVASKSVFVVTTSWSETHSASISHVSTSIQYFSSSFTGSQFSFGDKMQRGIYHSSFSLNKTDPYLSNYLGKDTELKIIPYWKSTDRTITFATGSSVVVKTNIGTNSNVANRNFVSNIINLKHEYTTQETARLRLFIQDYNTELRYNKIPIEMVSEVFSCVHWRLLDSYSKEILFDFDLVQNSTKLSMDGLGMYFDLFMSDLTANKVYELEFLVRENGQDYLITNQGFRFRLIP